MIKWLKESWKYSPHNLIGLIGCVVLLVLHIIILYKGLS